MRITVASSELRKLNCNSPRCGGTSGRRIRNILLGSVCAAAVGLAITMNPSQAATKDVKHKPDRREAEHVSKLPFGEMPKGPLSIFVSINQQKLHFYSDGVHIADEPVATGVPGHLTPLGVFSVIERDRNHHSNIYDNAPMPYMERITWSGVALHQGPGVGRQASHGCIRMPQDFAARLWELPTMGMRVIIARPELRPTEFADPHLFVHKMKLPATASARPSPLETAQAVDRGTRTDIGDPPVDAPAKAGAAAPSEHTVSTTEHAATSAPDQAPAQDAQASKPSASTAFEVTQSTTLRAAVGPSLADMARAAAAAVMQPNSPKDPASTNPDATNKATEAKPSDPSAAASSPAPGAQDPPAQPAPSAATQKAEGDAAPSTVAVPADADIPLPLDKPSRLARSDGGPIAIFVSRKEGRIYVRQDFTPVFDAPVKIEHPDQPLGTHVFTAMNYTPDHATFRWTVVTMPSERPQAAEHSKSVKDADGRRRRDRLEDRAAEAAEPPPPAEAPADALARIDIPPDVIDQISRMIVPGSSLVISDHGLGEETGEGTDFIVVMR